MQTMAMIFRDEVADTSTVTTSVGPGAGIYMVDARDVADVAAEVLRRAAHSGETLVIHGPEPLSYLDCSQKVGAALGRAINYVQISDEEARARLLEAGFGDYLTEAFVTLFQMYSSGRYEPEADDVITSWTGHDPRAFDDYTASEDFAASFV